MLHNFRPDGTGIASGTVTTSGLSDYLGVSQTTVVRRLQRGMLPAYRIARSWIIFHSEIVAFQAGGSTPPDILLAYPPVLSVTQVARLFGKSRTTIRRWIALGEPPAFTELPFPTVTKVQLQVTLERSSNEAKWPAVTTTDRRHSPAAMHTPTSPTTKPWLERTLRDIQNRSAR